MDWQIDWYTDFYYPFLSRWADRVRAVSDPDKMVFVEAIPNEVRYIRLARFILLSAVSVLPRFVDARAPAEEYGVCTTLVRSQCAIYESLWGLLRQRPRAIQGTFFAWSNEAPS